MGRTGRPTIALLSNGLTPDHLGGLQRYVRELGTALAREGADVAILARRRDPELPLRERGTDGVDIVRFDSSPKSHPLYAVRYPWEAARASRRFLAARPNATAHAHFALQGIGLTMDSRPFAYTFHAPVHREIRMERQGSYRASSGVEQALVTGSRLSERRILRTASLTLTLSEFMQAEAVATAGEAIPVTVLPGGVDTHRFSPGESSLDDPWMRGSQTLFTARRLVERTGVGTLIEAMRRIHAVRPEVRLAIAGIGPLEARLRQQIVDAELTSVVRLLGRVSEDELVAWYRAACLVVLPTQQLEGFGLTTAEAMACGTGVVGTPVGATPELLRELDPALISRDASSGALAEAVIRALSEQDVVALGKRARALAEARWSWSAIAQRHLELYEQMPPARTPA